MLTNGMAILPVCRASRCARPGLPGPALRQPWMVCSMN
jgi:hypothetical protein